LICYIILIQYAWFFYELNKVYFTYKILCCILRQFSCSCLNDKNLKTNDYFSIKKCFLKNGLALSYYKFLFSNNLIFHENKNKLHDKYLIRYFWRQAQIKHTLCSKEVFLILCLPNLLLRHKENHQWFLNLAIIAWLIHNMPQALDRHRSFVAFPGACKEKTNKILIEFNYLTMSWIPTYFNSKQDKC